MIVYAAKIQIIFISAKQQRQKIYHLLVEGSTSTHIKLILNSYRTHIEVYPIFISIVYDFR